MQTAVEKGKLAAADRDAALARLSFTTRVEDLSGCDLVVEAATENPEEVEPDDALRAAGDRRELDDGDEPGPAVTRTASRCEPGTRL